ncbi:hypothetical protein Tco_1008688 [Tanacetum coccineum]
MDNMTMHVLQMSMGRVFKTRFRRRGVKLPRNIDLEFKIVNEYSVRVNKGRGGVEVSSVEWSADLRVGGGMRDWVIWHSGRNRLREGVSRAVRSHRRTGSMGRESGGNEEERGSMRIIPDEEEVAIDAIPLATKPPTIIDWKIHKE